MLATGAYVLSPRHQLRSISFRHDDVHLQLDAHLLLLWLLLLWPCAGESERIETVE
jgi:hypothetical protein